jgi:hypothetical protein
MAIDRIVVGFAVRGGRLQVSYGLVSEEIEVDPLGRAAPFCTT